MESALFYLDTLIDMDSLKNQGINTNIRASKPSSLVGYSLKNQGINTSSFSYASRSKLDIHLKIKVLTPRRAEFDEFQPFITKIK